MIEDLCGVSYMVSALVSVSINAWQFSKAPFYHRRRGAPTVGAAKTSKSPEQGLRRSVAEKSGNHQAGNLHRGAQHIVCAEAVSRWTNTRWAPAKASMPPKKRAACAVLWRGARARATRQLYAQGIQQAGCIENTSASVMGIESSFAEDIFILMLPLKHKNRET